jgi:hypothetical protein
MGNCLKGVTISRIHRISRTFVFVLAAWLGVALQAVDSPGKFGFHIFPPSQGQDLAFASRPVSDGKSGFWFYEPGSLWRFDALGYRQLGTEDGLPKEPVERAFPEPSTGMWFWAGNAWYLLGQQGVRRISGPKGPDDAAGRSCLAIRNEGFGVVEDGRLRIYNPTGQMVDLPSPGAGDWVKGWKDPHGDARLLVGDQGLARWNGRAWAIQSLKGVLEGRGQDVFRVKSGALWVRSDRDLVRIEPNPVRFGPRMGITRNSFVTIEEDSFGRVWTNGPEGLVCVDGDQVWRIGEREGLAGYQSYWPIAFDPQGNLWTISASGFQQLKGAFLWSVQEQPFGLPRTMVFEIRRRLYDGALYAGTHDGLYRQKGAQWEEIKGSEGWAPFTLAERKNGEFWCGGNPPYPHELSILRMVPGRAPVHPAIAGLPKGDWTFQLKWTADDTLWCGTAKGFYRIRPHGSDFIAEPVALPGLKANAPINSLDLAPDGSLWVGTETGLFRLEGTTWTHLGKSEGLAADSISGAFLGPREEWWVMHGESRAITRFAKRPDKGWDITGQFNKNDLLTAAGASAGWTDPNGVVWLVSEKNVVRWDGKRVDRFSKAFGMPIDDIFPTICGEPTGEFWIGSIAGVLHCDPHFYRPIPDPPALVQGNALDGQGKPFLAGAEIPFRKTGVTFELELPLVAGVEDLDIQTRVMGLDEAWHPLTGNLLRLSGLPPGAYVLEARAARMDGLTGPGISFPFTILRPWYLRNGTLFFAFLASIAIGMLVFRWRTWSLHLEQERLEALVSQRTKDLTDANEALTKALADVRTLKGLVPICSYCKRIRNDEGFWRQLELVLSETTEAQLSHGICPECAPTVRASWEAELASYDLNEPKKIPNT